MSGCPRTRVRVLLDRRDLEPPPWLRFQILTPSPIAMRVGGRIADRLRLRGVPPRWRTRELALRRRRRLLQSLHCDKLGPTVGFRVRA
jgi:hypothetical protein